MLRTIRFLAEARDARQKSLVQEAGAACPIVCTPPPAAEAQCPDACPQDGRVRSADRDAGTVTEHGGAATGTADSTHESVSCRSAERLAKISCAGGRGRLPYSLYATAGCGSAMLERLNEAAKGARGAGTSGWARRSATNKWFQPKRGLLPKSAPGGVRVSPMKGHLFPAAAAPPYASGREITAHAGSGPGGPTPEVGTRGSPIFPDGSKLPPAARRLGGRDESRPGAQESRLKLGRCGM